MRLRSDVCWCVGILASLSVDKVINTCIRCFQFRGELIWRIFVKGVLCASMSVRRNGADVVFWLLMRMRREIGARARDQTAPPGPRLWAAIGVEYSNK